VSEPLPEQVRLVHGNGGSSGRLFLVVFGCLLYSTGDAESARAEDSLFFFRDPFSLLNCCFGLVNCPVFFFFLSLPLFFLSVLLAPARLLFFSSSVQVAW
jgi:hypothetical protein